MLGFGDKLVFQRDLKISSPNTREERDQLGKTLPPKREDLKKHPHPKRDRQPTKNPPRTKWEGLVARITKTRRRRTRVLGVVVKTRIKLGLLSHCYSFY